MPACPPAHPVTPAQRAWSRTIPFQWDAPVREARLSPDASTLWTLHADNARITWDAATGDALDVRAIARPFSLHAISARGTLFWLGHDGHLWSIAHDNNTPVRLFHCDSPRRALEVAPDESLVRIDDGLYRLTGERHARLARPVLAFSPRWTLVLEHGEGELVVRRVRDNAAVHHLALDPRDHAYTAAFFPDDSGCVVQLDGDRARAYRFDRGAAPVWTRAVAFGSHPRALFANDRGRVACATPSALRVLSAETGSELSAIHRPILGFAGTASSDALFLTDFTPIPRADLASGGVEPMAFSRYATAPYVTASTARWFADVNHCKARTFDTVTGDVVSIGTESLSAVPVFSADEKTLYVLDRARLRALDPRTGELLFRWDLPPNAHSALAVSADEAFAVFLDAPPERPVEGREPCTLQCVDLNTSRIVWERASTDANLRGLRLSEDGQHAWVVCDAAYRVNFRDGIESDRRPLVSSARLDFAETMELYALDEAALFVPCNGRAKHKVTLGARTVRGALSPDGQWAVVQLSATTAALLSASQDHPIDTLRVERDKLSAFAWSGDAQSLFARTVRGAVLVCSLDP